MKKILIPQNYFSVTKDHMLCLAQNTNFNDNNPCTLFSNPDYHSVIIPPSRQDRIIAISEGFFHKLKINGPLEIKSISKLHFNHWDFLYCESPVLTLTSSNTKKLEQYYDEIADIELSLYGLPRGPWKPRFKEININSQTAKFSGDDLSSLETLNINSKRIVELKLKKLHNLKSVNLPNLEKIAIGEDENMGLLDRFDISPTTNFTINSKCKIDFKYLIHSCGHCPLSSLLPTEIQKENLSLQSIIEKYNPKTYTKNQNNTFTISFLELKTILSKQIIEFSKQQIDKSLDIINKEEQNIKTTKVSSKQKVH